MKRAKAKPGSAGRPAKLTPAKRRFSHVVDALTCNRDVTHGGDNGFGSGALKVHGKIFAMLSSKNQFVVKLPKDRVYDLVASGKGERFEPRPGKADERMVYPPE